MRRVLPIKSHKPQEAWAANRYFSSTPQRGTQRCPRVGISAQQHNFFIEENLNIEGANITLPSCRQIRFKTLLIALMVPNTVKDIR